MVAGDLIENRVDQKWRKIAKSQVDRIFDQLLVVE